MNYLKYMTLIKNKTVQKCAIGGIIVVSLVTGIGYLVKNDILQYSKKSYGDTESEIIQNIPEDTRVNDEEKDTRVNDEEKDTRVNDEEKDTRVNDEEKDTRVNDEEKDTRDKLDCNVDEYMRELTDDEELLDIVKLMEIDV